MARLSLYQIVVTMALILAISVAYMNIGADAAPHVACQHWIMDPEECTTCCELTYGKGSLDGRHCHRMCINYISTIYRFGK